jgi:hypothetical protein
MGNVFVLPFMPYWFQKSAYGFVGFRGIAQNHQKSPLFLADKSHGDVNQAYGHSADNRDQIKLRPGGQTGRYAPVQKSDVKRVLDRRPEAHNGEGATMPRDKTRLVPMVMMINAVIPLTITIRMPKLSL